MDWKEIPSLSALRAFDAMARHGGFSAAARELNVTHVAISQHVRSLEAALGRALVLREGRKMALTPDGAVLAAGLAAGFGEIHGVIRTLRAADADRPIAISLTPSFAENWLMPRIAEFWNLHPEIGVTILPSAHVVDLRREGIDIAIRYGRGDWPGVTAERLIGVNFIVVGAPKFAQEKPARRLTDLSHLPWVVETEHREHRRWCEGQGLDFSEIKTTYLATNTLTLAALRAGLGITVQSRAMVEADLADGRLVELFTGQDQDVCYFMVTLGGVPRDGLKKLMAWLRHSVSKVPAAG